MNIDIALISRERPERFARMYKSFISHATDDQRLNFYVGVDSDDPTLDQYLYLGEMNNNINIVDLPDSYNKPNMGAMFLQTFKQCRSDIVGWFGDDNICLTQGWDDIVLAEMGNAPAHGIRMVYGRDGIHDVNLATWSFFSRKVVELGLLDGIEPLCVDYSDVYIMNLFKANGCACYRPDLYIKHDHPIAGGEVDHVFIRNRQAENMARAEKAWRSCQGRLWMEVERLKQIINGGV